MKIIKKSYLTLGSILLLIAAGIILCLYVGSGNGDGSGLCINEILFSSSWIEGKDPDHPTEWIELYNGTEQEINLKSYALSDDMDDIEKWIFPDVTIEAGDYLLVYAEKYAGEGLKTNFNLANEGETVIFSSPEGEIIDLFRTDEVYEDYSIGRYPDGGDLAVLSRATAGVSNNISHVAMYVQDSEDIPFGDICFSHEGGYYQEAFSLELSAAGDETIVYTLDGSEPGLTSKVYKGAIEIRNRENEENLYAGKVSTSYLDYGINQVNEDPIPKGTVVRARLIKNGILDSEIYTKTYFVGMKESITSISIVTDPENLFDPDKGIYTKGKIFDWEMRSSDLEQKNDIYYIGNYSIKGEVSERPAHLEVYSSEGALLADQNIGIRIGAGMHKRKGLNKTLRLFASEKYDQETSFDLSGKYSEDGSENPTELVVRTNQDYVRQVLSDAFITTLFLDEGMGVQMYEPVVLYIDGEFWGLAALREKSGEELICSHFNIKKDDLVLLSTSKNIKEDYENQLGVDKGTEEDLQDYLSLITYVQEHDMSLEENYEYIADRMDMDSFIKNWWAHIYFASRDWPDNNIRVFRAKNTSGEAAKWRYVLFDMDESGMDYDHNTLLYAMGMEERNYENWESGNGKAQEWSVRLFGGLMKNSVFRQKFYEQYLEYRETVFEPSFLKEYLTEMIKEAEPYFDLTENRWKVERSDWFKTVLSILPDTIAEKLDETWIMDIEGGLEEMYTFVENRRDYMDGFMKEYYQTWGENIELK
ncbi:MAG: CotH kinase family protein [Eubacteriales bacterium]|nr:CotH kinase family protein [Eubacteriales bacterium]